MAELDQARAFHRQAQADWALYQHLSQKANLDGFPECQRLHYLQMAGEKLAKALHIALGAQLRAGGHSHVAFSRLPYLLNCPDAARACGRDADDQHEWNRYGAELRRMQAPCREIEQLGPAVREDGTAGPNVEYPWYGGSADGEKRWIAPADHSFVLLRQPADVLPRVTNWVGMLLNRFEELAAIGNRDRWPQESDSPCFRRYWWRIAVRLRAA